jgi:beta-glucosidase
MRQDYDVRGYLHWTLTDNFQWNEGWTLRFGLVALDMDTLHPTMRSIAKSFSEIVGSNGIASPDVRQIPSFFKNCAPATFGKL